MNESQLSDDWGLLYVSDSPDNWSDEDVEEQVSWGQSLDYVLEQVAKRPGEYFMYRRKVSPHQGADMSFQLAQAVKDRQDARDLVASVERGLESMRDWASAELLEKAEAENVLVKKNLLRLEELVEALLPVWRDVS